MVDVVARTVTVVAAVNHTACTEGVESSEGPGKANSLVDMLVRTEKAVVVVEDAENNKDLRTSA